VINKKDILGYLYVLNDQSVWNQLTAGEQSYGKAHVIGCYSRLMDSLLEHDLSAYNKVKDREVLNCVWDNPEQFSSKLKFATNEVALMLFGYLRKGVFKTIENQFVAKLDLELEKILESK
jgi:hypothetical protein